nr:hypothetical protein [uncultured Draconibacterium sp.]
MATTTPTGIPEPVINEATQLITNALTVLKPYLIALTPMERRTMTKMSDRSYPFVEKTRDYTISLPQFIPPYMDAAKLNTDLELYDHLIDLLRLSKQLTNGLDDTAMKVGGACFSNALNYYGTTKQATKLNVPGAKNTYEDLSKRFAKNRNDKEEEAKEEAEEQ